MLANLAATNNPITIGGNLTANVAGTTTTVANLITTRGVFWPNGAAYSSGSSGSGLINLGIYVTSATVTTAPTLVDSVPLSGNTGIRWTTTAVDNISANVRMSTIDVLANVSTVNYTEYGYLISNTLANTTTFTSNIYSGSIALWAQGSSSSVTITVRREILGSGTTTGYINVGPAGTVPANLVGTTLTTTGNITVGGSLYVTSNVVAGTTTRVEYNIPHPFMLMGT